jgi:hypothetical protein
VAAYGAAAKGITLLNACLVTNKDIEFVADRNPHKQGKWLPGSRIPVVSPDAIFDTMPDDVIILPWNLTHEISRSLMGYVAQGGRLWTLIPAPRVVNCASEDFDFDQPAAMRGFGLEGHTAAYDDASLQEVVAA